MTSWMIGTLFVSGLVVAAMIYHIAATLEKQLKRIASALEQIARNDSRR